MVGHISLRFKGQNQVESSSMEIINLQKIFKPGHWYFLGMSIEERGLPVFTGREKTK